MAEKMILGLCTSGSRLKVSVFDGKAFQQAQRKVYNQEKVLFPLIKRLLARAGAELRGVDLVCAVRGPGRFTGIRIALTLAGALKALAGAKVRTVTLFEILAFQAAGCAHFLGWSKGRKRRLAVLLHAFKDEYFCQFFSAAAGGRPRPAGEPVWLKAEGMKELLAAEPAPFYAVADAEESADIYSLVPGNAVKAPASVSKIVPACVIKAALACGNATLKPLYLKPAKYELENNVRPAASR
jgi:tRNA threonylcarbamoyladenosine biosynthesis protein TsaB